MVMYNRVNVQSELEDLFVEAKKEGLWFYLISDDIWLSPDDLKKYQDNGMYLYVPSRWLLRDPKDLLKVLESEKNRIERRINSIKSRLNI